MKSICKIDGYGDKCWFNYKNELHREDGPAVECVNGDKLWYINNKLHRLNGPAYEGNNGSKEWWVNGKRHREEGPAIEYANGNKSWYYDYQYIECKSQKEFEKIIRMRIFMT